MATMRLKGLPAGVHGWTCLTTMAVLARKDSTGDLPTTRSALAAATAA